MPVLFHQAHAHLCFGNYAGRPLAKRTFAPVFDRTMQFRVDQLVLEFANRELAELELCRDIAAHRDLVLGLVGTQGLFDTHAYAASKAGTIGLTRAIATHYAQQHLRANVIAPGLIDTQMAARAKANHEVLEQVAFWQPLGAMGQARDVA